MKMDEHLVDELTVYRVLVLSEALSDFDAAVTGSSLLCHLHEVSHSFHSPGAPAFAGRPVSGCAMTGP